MRSPSIVWWVGFRLAFDVVSFIVDFFLALCTIGNDYLALVKDDYLPKSLGVVVLAIIMVVGPFLQADMMARIGWLGVPISYWYLLIVWLVLILCTFILSRRFRHRDKKLL